MYRALLFWAIFSLPRWETARVVYRASQQGPQSIISYLQCTRGWLSLLRVTFLTFLARPEMDSINCINISVPNTVSALICPVILTSARDSTILRALTKSLFRVILIIPRPSIYHAQPCVPSVCPRRRTLSWSRRYGRWNWGKRCSFNNQVTADLYMQIVMRLIIRRQCCDREQVTVLSRLIICNFSMRIYYAVWYW